MTMLNKGSALRVSEAMDMVEEFTGEAAELLEQAKIVATEARKVADIPRGMEERLIRLITDINRIDYVSNAIKAVRVSLTGGAARDKKKRWESSRQPILLT